MEGRARVLPLITIAAYIFLYLPLVLLVLSSFQKTPMTFMSGDFCLYWYKRLLHAPELIGPIKNSLIVAFSAMVLSEVMGVLLVFFGSQRRWRSMAPAFVVNVMVPEIVLAVGLLSFYMIARIPLGCVTLIVGHTLLGLGYVVPMLYSRFEELDYRITEASLDLGASESYTLTHVMFPLLRPAITTSALLVFIVSLDDFIISFFCAGTEAQTLSLHIFALLREGTSPLVSVLSTIILGISAIVVLVISYIQVKNTDSLSWS